MFNKSLFDRICNVTCSFDELQDFVADINKKEFDLDNAFKKYYDVNKILLAIEKYQSQEIDAKYLAYWMNAYNWIIMGGFDQGQWEEGLTLKEFLIWTIVDWIDGLSFFDIGFHHDLEKYKTVFKVLDSVLQDLDDCTAVFTENSYDDNTIVLITNDNAKYFIKVYGDLDDDGLLDCEKVEFDDLTNKVEELRQLGYQELKYTDWNPDK